MHLLPKEVLLFCQVFGGFPFKYIDHPKGKHTVAFCTIVFKWGLAAIIAQTLITYANICTNLIDLMVGKSDGFKSSTSMVTVIDYTILNAMALILFINCAKKYPKFIEMCCILDKFDQFFQQRVHEKATCKKVILLFIYMLILVICSGVIEVSLEKHAGLGAYIATMASHFAAASLLIHFTHSTQSISRRFKIIGDNFEKESMKKGINMLLRDLCLPNPVIFHAGNMSAVTRLRTLTDLYWLLCEAVHQANAFYSAQLLAAIFSSFVHIIITLYYFFLHIWPTVDPQQAPYLVMQLFWILTHISHLVLLVWPSTAVTDAANETAPIICKLINRELDPAMRKHMETFLLQLLHHNAKFSALGFFQIHSHILTSIAGSVTTYLVILIQFQTSSSYSNTTSHPFDLSSHTSAVCAENITNI